MWLLLWGVVLLVITFVYMLVCVDANKGGVLAKIKIFVFITLPDLVKKCIVVIFGERVFSYISRLITYVCYSQNPLVQMIYLACACGGFAVYVYYGFPYVPNAYLDSYHKYIGTVLMFCCYYSYYKACRVDPGYITSKTRYMAKNRFKYDKLMF